MYVYVSMVTVYVNTAKLTAAMSGPGFAQGSWPRTIASSSSLSGFLQEGLGFRGSFKLTFD